MISNVAFFFNGQLISSFAFELFHSSLAFHVLATTGSPFKFASTYIFDTLPKAIFVQIAGSFIDKVDRKKFFVLIDILQACYLAIVFFLAWNSYIDSSYYYYLAIGSGLLKAFSYPVTKTVVPLLDRGDKTLKANSYEVSIDKITRSLAPVLSVLLFAKFGFIISVAFSLTAYLFAACIKSFVKLQKISLDPVAPSLKSPINMIFNNKLILLAWMNSAVTQAFFHPFIVNVIPNLLKKKSASYVLAKGSAFYNIVLFLGGDSADVYLSLYAFVGIGSALGVVASIVAFQRNKKHLIEGMSAAVRAIFLVGLLSTTVVVVADQGRINLIFLAVILFVINAMFYYFFNTYTVFFASFYQKRVSKAMLGRFVANLITIFMVSKTIGHYIYGSLLEKGFIIPAIVCVGGGVLKILILSQFNKALKESES